MKKGIALLMVFTMLVTFVACGNNSSVESQPEETVYNLGDTVSTDIIEFTLKGASLGYYAQAPSTQSDGTVANLEEACKPISTDNSIFAASKGHVLTCLDIVIKNTDRDSLDTNDNIVAIEITQGDNSAEVRGYDLNNKDGLSGSLSKLSYSAISENGGPFYTNTTSNTIISAGATEEIRFVGIAGFEAEDLMEPFSITVSIKASNGEKESYSYEIDPSIEIVDDGAQIQNILESLNNAKEELSFVYNYAGNVSASGSRAFADSRIESIKQCLDGVDTEYLDSNFPDTAKELPSIRENIETIVSLLIDMGETNSDQNVEMIKSLASNTIQTINTLMETIE